MERLTAADEMTRTQVQVLPAEDRSSDPFGSDQNHLCDVLQELLPELSVSHSQTDDL